MEKGIQAAMIDDTNLSKDIIIDIRYDPVMQTAIDSLQLFSKARRVILKASGNAIPNAVAVANILTDNMLKDKIHVQKITVDSDAPAGIGRMTSIIEIIIVKN